MKNSKSVRKPVQQHLSATALETVSQKHRAGGQRSQKTSAKMCCKKLAH